jgi:hypothetical protein
VGVGFAVLLLILAVTSQGAFAVSRWAPLALFALAVLLGALLVRGGLVVRTRGVVVTLTGIWGLAAWDLLSMLWAQSPASAFQAGDRTVLYAAIATLPLMLPAPRRALARAGWAITAGIGAIGVFILIRLLVDGGPLFLAGRLNGPVNYRNATALLFAMAVPPCIVAAAGRTYRRSVRATALALATLCLGLAFLTQSRGILLGLGLGEVVILALGPDRVRRAWVSLLPIAAVALSSGWLLRPFHAFDGGAGVVPVHDITVAAWGLTAATAWSFVVGLVLALFDSGVRANSPQMTHLRRAARIALALAAVVVVAGALTAMGNPVTYARQKWDQFTSLQSTTPTTTRLLTVGGQRYDLWRVAVKEFEAHPILGVGADNYSFGYYRLRATNRNLNDPHSLVFATLAESGVVGCVLLAMFLIGVAASLWAGWRRLDDGARRPAVAAAAAGAVLIGQSTVDWMWLIPGLSAIGVFCLALAAAQGAAAARPLPVDVPVRFLPGPSSRPPASAALASGSAATTATAPAATAPADGAAPDAPAPPGAPAADPGPVTPGAGLPSRAEPGGDPVVHAHGVLLDSGPAPASGRPPRPVPAATCAAGLAIVAAAMVGVLALFLSDAYIQQARTEVDDPPAELSAARTAATLDPWSVTPHYLEASALESAGDRPAAFDQLHDALQLEPANFATLGVIGDFEARGGNLRLARSYYRRALALDPLDTGLQQLAQLDITPASSPHRAVARRRR